MFRDVYATSTLMTWILMVKCEDVKSSGLKAIEDNCENVTISSKRVITPVGWSVQIRCPDADISTVYDYRILSATKVRCVIKTGNKIVSDNNITLLDRFFGSYASWSTFKVPSLTADGNGSTYTTYTIANSSCSAISYELIVQQSTTSETCSNATFYSTNSIQLFEGDKQRISCLVTDFPFDFQNETFRVNWYKDCHLIKMIERKGTKGPIGNFRGIDVLQISKANFNSTAGVYSCSVTYKGHELFVAKTKTCVRYRSAVIEHFQQLSELKSKVTVGVDAVLTCGGVLQPHSFLHYVVWTRHFANGTDVDVCHPRKINEYDLDQKYQCNWLTNRKAATLCHTDAASANSDPHKGVFRGNSTLVIRDFQRSDEGKYSCRLVSNMGISQTPQFDISLSDWNPLIIILPSVLGFILLLLLIFVFVVCVKRRIHWGKLQTKSLNSSPEFSAKEVSCDQSE